MAGNASFKAAKAEMLKTIAQHGKLAISHNMWLERNVALYGPKSMISASNTIAARFTKDGETKPKSKVVVVGQAPNGFGKQIDWDSGDAEIALVIFLNAADPLGVTISSVRAADTIEFVFAGGLASFAIETENEGIGSIIGLIAAGAKVGTIPFGVPELIPVIDATEKFAKSNFKEAQDDTKRRNPFGIDPDGKLARQEGGVIISLPGAGRMFYSGESEDRWIKEPGTRDEAHHPHHLVSAFYLQGRTMRTAGADGDIAIYPWDWKFADNLGFYKLHVLLKRGNRISDGPPIR
ncbi:MAG: hypothetical protein HZB51_12590 [Chloroflexi bacterium]|nr:hypothetical protein [Chloroflexota bacterium]